MAKKTLASFISLYKKANSSKGKFKYKAPKVKYKMPKIAGIKPRKLRIK